MRLDLYTTCWNDARMLEFFFRHYDQFVQRYVVYDDGSTDGSLDILRAHPRVEVRRFQRDKTNSFVLAEQRLSNQCWKESRGRADWVLVLDVDEHLLHPDFLEYLSGCRNARVTIVPALGFQMMTTRFPSTTDRLSEVYVRGAPWIQMCKCSVFDPDEIDEINFTPGRHRVEPSGNVRAPRSDELLNLHYKYLGFEYTVARHRELLRGLCVTDDASGWGHKYHWSEEQLRDDWNRTEAELVAVASDPRATVANYPLPRWWEEWRG